MKVFKLEIEELEPKNRLTFLPSAFKILYKVALNILKWYMQKAGE